MDLDILCGLDEDHPELTRRSDNQASSDGLTRLQGMWERAYEQMEAKLTSQRSCNNSRIDASCLKTGGRT